MQKSLRSDAKSNRDQIIHSAGEVFAEKGMGVSLDVVIDRARVGRATFYRNFADRTALIIALMEASFQNLEKAAMNQYPRDIKVFCMLSDIGESLTKNPALADAWRFLGENAGDVERFRDRLRALFRQPVLDAVNAKALRSDFSVEDVFLVVSMLGTVVRYDDARCRALLVRRIISLITNGIAGPDFLPSPASALAEI